MSPFYWINIDVIFSKTDTADEQFQAFCLKPVGSVKCYPTLVKTLERGCKVGYGCTYTVEKEECIATFPVGYADGYWRHLSGKGIVIRDKTGMLSVHVCVCGYLCVCVYVFVCVCVCVWMWIDRNLLF